MGCTLRSGCIVTPGAVAYCLMDRPTRCLNGQPTPTPPHTAAASATMSPNSKSRRKQLAELQQDAQPDQGRREYCHHTPSFMKRGQEGKYHVGGEMFDLVADVEFVECPDWGRIAGQKRADDHQRYTEKRGNP